VSANSSPMMFKVCSWCGHLIQAGHGPETSGICKRGDPCGCDCVTAERAKLRASREAEELKRELALEQFLESKRV
jgi:hypothetical protein